MVAQIYMSNVFSVFTNKDLGHQHFFVQFAKPLILSLVVAIVLSIASDSGNLAFSELCACCKRPQCAQRCYLWLLRLFYIDASVPAPF